jgi:tetratricopeptide (TPR) repeat protein
MAPGKPSFCKGRSLRSLILLALFSGAFSVPAQAEEAALPQAKKLMLEGKPEAAYQLLLPLEDTARGSPQFDYLLGVAALDAGHPELAVFPLERALALLPGEAHIHADLARAYAAMGERDAARLELETARKLTRSPETALLLDRHLSLLGTTTNEKTNHFSGHVSLALGHDSNVNSATSNNQMAIPAFGGFTFMLDGKSVQAGSNFSQLGGAVSLQHAFNEQTQGSVRLASTERHYASQSNFDTGNRELAFGLQHRQDRHSVSLAVQEVDFALAGNDYRYSYGTSAQWQMQLTPASQGGLFVQLGRLHYPSAPLRDGDRRVGGLFYGQMLDLPQRPLLYGSLYGGREQPNNAAYPFLGHHLNGLRLGAEVALSPRWQVHTGLGFEHRNYGGNDPLFLTRRVDNQTEFSLGGIYLIQRDLSLKPTLSYLHNASNLPLNRFERTELSLSVRKEF